MSSKDDSDTEDNLINTQPNKVAIEFINQAEKRLKSISFFNPTKYDDAIELYDKAAVQYKITNNWKDVAKLYVLCAELCEKYTTSFEACNFYVNAGNAYKRFDLNEAVNVFLIGAEIHQQKNNFSTAAKLYKEIGVCYEKLMKQTEAIKMWKKASDCYNTADASTNSNQCLLRVADLYTENEEYKKAAELYEKISKNSLDSTTGIWTIKDHLNKALLCHFVSLLKSNSINLLEQKMEEYKDLCPRLEDSHEYKLIHNVLQTYLNDDIDQFNDTVFKYNEIYKLDDFKTKMLYNIKVSLQNGELIHEEDDLC